MYLYVLETLNYSSIRLNTYILLLILSSHEIFASPHSSYLTLIFISPYSGLKAAIRPDY